MGYCNNINTFNLYLRKLFWKTRILELSNFSRQKTFSPSDKKKTKEQNPRTLLGECSKFQLQGETKDILFTQHCTGGEETSMLHVQKAEDFDQGPVFLEPQQ